MPPTKKRAEPPDFGWASSDDSKDSCVRRRIGSIIDAKDRLHHALLLNHKSRFPKLRRQQRRIRLHRPAVWSCEPATQQEDHVLHGWLGRLAASPVRPRSVWGWASDHEKPTGWRWFCVDVAGWSGMPGAGKPMRRVWVFGFPPTRRLLIAARRFRYSQY